MKNGGAAWESILSPSLLLKEVTSERQDSVAGGNVMPVTETMRVNSPIEPPATSLSFGDRVGKGDMDPAEEDRMERIVRIGECVRSGHHKRITKDRSLFDAHTIHAKAWIGEGRIIARCKRCSLPVSFEDPSLLLPRSAR